MGTITVTSLADDGSGGLTLREAIAEAAATAGADTIVFDESLAGGEITLNSVLNVTDDDYVTISGDIGYDGDSDITISGDYLNAFFAFTGTGNAAFYDLTLTDGYAYATSGGETAALIRVNSGANATFDGLTITNSRARGADAAYDSGTVGSDATTILVSRGGKLSIRNASIEASVSSLAGYGADAGNLYLSAAGGDAVVGIANDGTTYAENVGFAGFARGGKGGNGFAGLVEPGASGGDAFVGVVNSGDLYAVSTPYFSAIGISVSTPPTLVNGGGGLGSNGGGDGANGASGTGIQNTGAGKDYGLAVGDSFTQDADLISDDSALTAQVLLGLAGDDTLTSQGGGDTLLGGAGNDLFRIYGTSYSVGGGALSDGQNTFEVRTTTGDITVRGGLTENSVNNDLLDLGNIDVSGGSGSGVILTLGQGSLQFARTGLRFDVSYVRNVIGTTSSDLITGDNYSNNIVGNGGDDTLIGGGGTDLLSLSGYGEQSVDGGTGDDIIYLQPSGGDADITVTGGDEARDFLGFLADGGLRLDLALEGQKQTASSPLSANELMITISGIEDVFVFGSGNSVLQGTEDGNSINLHTGDDFIDGRGGNDTLEGSGGDDTIIGGGGNDDLRGGDQNDRLFGDDDDDTLQGGDGDDQLFGGDGNDSLEGGDGDDLLRTGTGDDDVLRGGGGDDTLIGDDGIFNELFGGDDNDLFQLLAGGHSVEGGAGADTVQFFETFDSFNIVDTGRFDFELIGQSLSETDSIAKDVETFIFADQTLTLSQLDAIVNPPPDTGGGDDTMSGGGGDDTTSGGGGDDTTSGGGGGGDTISGGGGDDTTSGGGGGDTMSGGGEQPAGPTSGDDLLLGTAGNDTINALAGNDTVNGLLGDDLIIGGGGADNIRGSGGDDRLRGNGGDDRLRGNGGDDNIKGGGGADNIKGNGGADVIKAGGGADTVKAGGGADVINGGGGADLLQGGGGADTLTGRGGDDTLRGNGGADVFQFRASDRNDTILDFRQGQDQIEIVSGARAFAALTIEQDGADVLIGFGAGQVRVVTDRVNAFDEDDFIF